MCVRVSVHLFDKKLQTLNTIQLHELQIRNGNDVFFTTTKNPIVQRNSRVELTSEFDFLPISFNKEAQNTFEN